MTTDTYRDYDELAWFYNRYWGEFSVRVWPVVRGLVLCDLPAGASILDVCCGTGQMARLLTERGYSVTGLDGSPEMLAFARENAPRAEFTVAHARSFSLSRTFHAALSLYDSLNHVMSLDELTAAFRNVHAALLPGGLFLFDLNTELGYKTRWAGGMEARVGDDHAFISRSSYDPSKRLARMDFTLFRLERGSWRRKDVSLFQREYSQDEVRSALERAGFRQVSVHEPYGPARAFFLASKTA
ncbi:MAG: class I SAM-dependent methyltransferase [Bacillota bacterium]